MVRSLGVLFGEALQARVVRRVGGGRVGHGELTQYAEVGPGSGVGGS